jgi:hypothetical protein
MLTPTGIIGKQPRLHQFWFPPQVLKSIQQSPVLGTLYDELEHSQITLTSPLHAQSGLTG